MLRLRLIDEAAARAIVAGECPTGMQRAPDYPAEADQVAARLFLERCAAGADPRPYGAFVVVLAARPRGLERAIGGVGFHGGVDERGRAEIGYGIVASHRARGHATQALRLLIQRGCELGATALVAEADPDNEVSQAVLRSHGFTLNASDERADCFERPLRCR